jgi:hypothetical protein
MSDQLGFWKSRAQELEIQVRRLEGENGMLKRQLASHLSSQSPQPPQQPGEITFLLKVPQGQPRSQLVRKTKVDSLLAAAPRTEDDWLERRNHLQLSNERSVVNTFLQFIDCTRLPVMSSDGIPNESSSTEALLRRYQKFT